MKLLRFGIVLSVFALLSFLLATKVNAASFNINTTDDGNDANPGDAVCEVNVGQNDCGLRALIEETNALGGTNSGIFDISGASVHTFAPATPYPGITNSLTLDAITAQDGAQCNTLVPANLPASNTPHSLMIEIDGTNAITGFGQGVIQFTNSTASGSVVKGLIINRANANAAAAILLGADNVNNVTIECNYLGTNAAGTSASANAYGISNKNFNVFNNNTITIQNNLVSGNSQSGISLASNSNLLTNTITVQNNLVGTTANGQSAIGGNSSSLIDFGGVLGSTLSHNVVSGSTSQGGVSYTNSESPTVKGNFIGLGVTGSPMANNGAGLSFFGTSNITIGGTGTSDRNFISANTSDGIHIWNNCNGSGSYVSTTFNNYIGTNTSGSVQAGYGNQGAGIEVNEYYGGCVSVYKHLIGGDAAGQPNIIAGNSEQGLLIHQSANQDVFSISSIVNSIYSNGQFGIDLAADSDSNSGVADTDLGPNAINNFMMSYPATNANYYINRPTINSTGYSGNQVTVNYSYQANGVTDNFPYILTSNLIGFRLDFYINSGGQDGAYPGYAQAKTHLGSFFINGSENGASHTFTSPISVTGNENITATATAVWQIIPDPGTNCQGDQWGDGPPYQETCVH